MHTIAKTILEKHGEEIHHFQVSSMGERVNEKVYSIIEFQTKWGAWAETVIRILEAQDTLLDNT